MTRVLHPVLLAIYPILFLFMGNMEEWSGLEPEQVLGPLVLTVLFTLAMYVPLRHELGPHRAGLVVSWILVLFFSFGHVRNALGHEVRLMFPALVHFGLWVSLMAGGIWWIVRRRALGPRPTFAMNAFAGLLVLMPLLGGAVAGTHLIADTVQGRAANGGEQPLLPGQDPLPNVYFIVLDEYANEHVLRETYGYDNEPFLDALRSRGFVVEGESVANYGMTYLAMSSTLNMGYLEGLPADGQYSPANFADVTRLIRDNAVARQLRDLGYDYVLLGSGWGPTDASPLASAVVRCTRYASEFERNLGDTTMLVAFEGRFSGTKRARVDCAFDSLGEMPRREGPFFVFAHVVAPHPPFVFAADGSAVDQRDVERARDDAEAQKRFYVGQLEYVSDRLLRTIDRIRAQEEVPPIILLMSDTGPSRLDAAYAKHPSDEALRERMRVLNAVSVPGANVTEEAWPNSPVNLFRALFNLRFGTSYEMLPDRSHFSNYGNPFRLREITDVVGFNETQISP